MRTEAAVCYEPNTPLEVEEVELDEHWANGVLIRMAATGVCHTDLRFMKGEALIALRNEGGGIG